MHIIIHTRERPARRIQRGRTVPVDGIREGLVEVDRVPLTKAVDQNHRLGDDFVESVRRVTRTGDGEEVRIDGFYSHVGPGDGVGHEDVFDLGDVFRRRGRDLFVGSIVGNERGDNKRRTAETGDECYGLRT